MDLSPIQLAIPVFFLLIGIEMLAARLVERDLYRLGDSVSNLSCGILQQVADVFLRSALFFAYAWLFANERRFELPAGAGWAWVACFLGVDFLYYWFHRWSHEVNAGWAAHVVHHQSEEMNLAVALRQGAFQQAFSWAFYLPLSVIGFPPAMFLAVSSFNTLYQFWIHTRLVGRLGPLEWVFNTPSHHRVHHGRNPQYIDRNHGGTLILWDRLFGTFALERDEPAYGITRPLASFNPLWANLHYWAEMWGLARGPCRPLDRLRVLWKRPGWRPENLGGPLEPPEVDRASQVKYEVSIPLRLKLYVLVHLVASTLGTVAFLYGSGRLTPWGRVMAALAIGWSLATLGGLIERRPWATGLEVARLAATAFALAVLPLASPLAAGGLAVVGVSAVVLRRGSEKALSLPAEVR